MAQQRILSDRYRLLVKVGEGGMAEVYRAQDMLLGRAVAVKLLRSQYTSESSFLVRFLQEAQAAAGLSHPNIVTVYDVGQDGDQRYIVMEYVEGINLKDIVLESAPLGIDRAVNIATQICQAVGVAHRAGLVHRDVKPQNVLLTSGDHVKVTDFGIAIALSAPKGLTEEGTVWGTPHYISPEQATGEDVGPTSDVYSIGVVLFEMLTGRLPFDGDSSVAIAMKHVREIPPPASRLNPAIPGELEAIIDKALSKLPEDRYRTASEFAQVLRSYGSNLGHYAEVPSAVPAQPIVTRPRSTHVPEPVVRQEVKPPERFVAEGTESQEGFDWLTVVFLVAAGLVLLALIPVGFFFYQLVLAPPPATPTPTPTVTLIRDDIRVPNLVGMGRDEAQGHVIMAGLQLDVVQEQYSETMPRGHILEQEKPPGQIARRGDTIKVVVSKGPEPKVVTLPHLVGKDAAEAERQLRKEGLLVDTFEQWGGPIPVGIVMQQAPVEGTEVQPGSTVRIAVSTGPRFQVDAVFDNAIILKSFDLERDHYTQGETLPLSLRWTTQTGLERDLNIFVHITRDGNNLVEKDNPPVQGARPTSGWVPGEMIEDTYALTIPPDAAPGDYWVEVGMYNPQNMQRLPVTNPGTVQIGSQSLILKLLKIQGR